MCVWMHVQHTRERRLCEANICMWRMARGNAQTKGLNTGLSFRARESRDPPSPRETRDTTGDGRGDGASHKTLH